MPDATMAPCRAARSAPMNWAGAREEGDQRRGKAHRDRQAGRPPQPEELRPKPAPQRFTTARRGSALSELHAHEEEELCRRRHRAGFARRLTPAAAVGEGEETTKRRGGDRVPWSPRGTMGAKDVPIGMSRLYIYSKARSLIRYFLRLETSEVFGLS
jgi:hypothetical protein